MADKRITIKLKDDKQVSLALAGEMGIEEALDMFNTAQLEILKTFDQQTEGKMKEELYKRAVWGFSLMIDQFHPEGKETRFGGLNEKAIMKAQNDILKENVDKKKKK